MGYMDSDRHPTPPGFAIVKDEPYGHSWASCPATAELQRFDHYLWQTALARLGDFTAVPVPLSWRTRLALGWDEAGYRIRAAWAALRGLY